MLERALEIEGEDFWARWSRTYTLGSVCVCVCVLLLASHLACFDLNGDRYRYRLSEARRTTFPRWNARIGNLNRRNSLSLSLSLDNLVIVKVLNLNCSRLACSDFRFPACSKEETFIVLRSRAFVSSVHISSNYISLKKKKKRKRNIIVIFYTLLNNTSQRFARWNFKSLLRVYNCFIWEKVLVAFSTLRVSVFAGLSKIS